MSVAGKARLKMASQGSQSSSQGTPVNLTPATHKRNSQLFTNSPLNSPLLSNLVNDDKSEKKKRLQKRLSDVAQRHLSSPATESRSKAPLSNLSGWNASQITEHLHNCIQLSRDNKINVRNAFSLHLIDTMKDMIRKEKDTNFQMAGSSIEAGAKIYASRVDALHLQAIQVLDQVSQLDKDGDAAVDSTQPDEDGSQGEGTQSKKKTIKKKKKIIETELKKINIANIDQSHEIDPLLQKLSKEGDSSFGGLLLGALRCSYDGSSLMLDMMCNTAPPSDLKLHDTPSDDHELPSVRSTDQLICPTFSQFEFNKAGQHPIFEALSNRNDELRYDPDKEVSFQQNDQRYDYGGAQGDDFSYDDDHDMGDMEPGEGKSAEFIDYIGKSSSAHGTASKITTDGTFNSLLTMVSGNTSDYSFFGNMKNMWAGPGHWKATRHAKPGFKRAGDDEAPTKAKKSAIDKVQFSLNFDAEIDFEKKFKNTRAATTVTKSTLERYKKQSLCLPEDLRYDNKDLLRLFTRPSVFIVRQRAEEAIDAGDHGGGGEGDNSDDYNYYNKNDVENFCPNLSGLTGGDDNDPYQHSVISQPTITDFDESLIAQPHLVEKINLQYAKRPKKVDFKRLKRNMWGLLTGEIDNDKENVDQNTAADDGPPSDVVKDGLSFHDMYGRLPTLCPSHESKDLSPPIAFVALLHMCNEKNLLLQATTSFADLKIYAGEK